MAYDRYENRGGGRDDHRRERGPRGERDERGFFERAREEVSSWFSDEESDEGGYRRPYDERGERERHERERHERERQGRNEDRGGFFGGAQPTSRGREGSDHRSPQSRSYPGQMSQSHRDRDQRPDFGRDRDDDDYRPMAGDYGRAGRQGYRSGMGSQDFARSQYGRQEFSQDQARDRESGGRSYNYGGWGDRESQRPSLGGGRHDEHYSSWRQRQIDELDRDYDDYRKEHQSKFESEFSGWRQQRQTKRQMLQSIREHEEVVDQNGEHIGTVDKVRGDKVILTKSDPEAGGVHRSFTCSLLDRVEDGKVYLSGTKDSIRGQLHEERGEGRDRGAMFGRPDEDRRQERGEPSQKEEGPHILDRSFSGTYEDSDTSKKK